MKFFNEEGAEIQEAAIDLSRGYVVPRELVHHDEVPAVTHVEETGIPGMTLKRTVTDIAAKPAYDEVVSQTYIMYPEAEAPAMDFGAEIEKLKALFSDHDAALAELGEITAGQDEAIAELGNAIVEEG